MFILLAAGELFCERFGGLKDIVAIQRTQSDELQCQLERLEQKSDTSAYGRSTVKMSEGISPGILIKGIEMLVLE